MKFDAPPLGLIGRSKRYAMLVDDGVVKVLHVDENPTVCDTSAGESMLEAI
jgi:cytochrome c peroxidase